jgi:hypothetical protein
MESTPQSNLFELQIDHNGTSYVRDAARWAKFLAVVGFIFCGLMVLVAILFASVLSSVFNTMGSAGPAFSGGLVSTVYILMALLFFFPCLYLYNFASKAQAALNRNDQEQLNVSFRNLRAYFRFLGILTIIYLSLLVLVFIIGIIGSAMR